MKQKEIQKDYGADLLHAVVFLLALLAVLWFMKI
jgi:hypothetical protein